MPTSYTTTVTVSGYTTGVTYGNQLDRLEITSGSTDPYQFPQPPTARASFIGLPTVYGVAQTPDWWIGKKLTFTITPQGATGNVTWSGNCVGVDVVLVDPQANTQVLELELQGQTSKLAMETVQNIIPASAWTNLAGFLNEELDKLTWAEAPWGLTWAGSSGTWASWNVNKSGCDFANLSVSSGVYYDDIDLIGLDFLGWLNTVFANKYQGSFSFDDTTVYLSDNNLATATPATTLSVEDCVIASSIVASANQNNVINAGRIEYSTSPGTYLYYSDATSVSLYGYRPLEMGQFWESSTLGQQALNKRVKAYKSPNSKLQSITIDLDLVAHNNVWWPALYRLIGWYRLTLTDVPAVYGGNDTYQVRGVQLNLTNKHAEATLLIVPTTVYNPA